MKNQFLLLLGLTATMTVEAQLSLTYQTHAYKVGDKHDYFLAQAVEEGNSGSNMIWDYSGLTAQSTFTSFMINPGTTEKGTLFATANLALVEAENTFYFRVDGEGMTQLGAANACSVTSYEAPFDKLKYPLRFGDVVSGNFSGTTQTGENYSTEAGSYEIKADAWGMLILPNGFYTSTLRVRQTRLFHYPNGADLKEVTYRWYCSSLRYPVLVIIKFETGTSSSIYKVAYYAHEHSEKQDNTVLADNQANLRLEVSPNPFFDQVKVKYQLDAAVKLGMELLDNNGRVVKVLQDPAAKQAGNYEETLSVPSNLPVGSYFLKVTYGKLVMVKKLMKV